MICQSAGLVLGSVQFDVLAQVVFWDAVWSAGTVGAFLRD